MANQKTGNKSGSESTPLPYSFLKDIYIRLHDYKFFHSAFSVDKPDKRFRGRKSLENKLHNILDNSETKSGAYLITGYRGVGKTSLVNKVLRKLTYEEVNGQITEDEKKDAPIIVRVNLGHDELKEKDILNLIAKSLLKRYTIWNSRFTQVKRNSVNYLILLSIFLCSFFIYGITTGKNIFTSLLDIYNGLDYLDHEILLFNDYKPLIDFSVLLLLIVLIYRFSRWILTVVLEQRIKTNRSVIRKLRFLNQRIDSYITNENDVNLKSSNFGFRFGSKLSYTIAGSRDIEVALIEIFEYIERIGSEKWRKKRPAPKLIFVFDELDKIEARQNLTISEKEGVENPESKISTSAEETRKRQERISKILANLKHFFSTARAKFIFIAGREMYDATLADISDRNYFLGSIFHDVIYVNSFLTEDTEDLDKKEGGKNIDHLFHRSYDHSMAEEFLCQFLMPSKGFLIKEKKIHATLGNSKTKIEPGYVEKKMSISLKTYNEYLKYEVDNLKDHEREKLILTLNQFVTYLLHRSSGSPKKLTHLLETFICNKKDVLLRKDQEYKDTRFIIAAKKKDLSDKELLKKETFLYFDYYSQHVFGFINYLSIPYYYNISRYVRRYNDKLMVSTSYLIDHFYKFHDFGFSWRNLEVTPEIIDIHKAPTLRKLIEDIVNFLSYTHLQHVVSGLYDFKFKKKISYEINFISKISEREAAALNFTLDEAYEVKGHFLKKLEKLLSDYKSNQDDTYIHSMGYVQQSLGDLYYYDQQYDDASVIYKDAVQYIKTKSESEALSLRLIVIFSRIMLKLGLSFERKKAFTSAYMAYTELSNLVLKSVEYEIGKIGKQKRLAANDKTYVTDFESSTPIEESEVNYFEEIFKQPLYSATHADIIQGNVTETVRLLYQAFVAKLYIQHREKIGGVQDRDIDLVRKEISFLTKVTNPIVEKKILSEYHNKIGDFLFFTNYKSDTYSCVQMYSCALEYFIQSIQADVKFKYNYIIDLIFEHLVGDNTRGFNFEELKMVASNISDYGDSYLSEVSDYTISPFSLTVIGKLFEDPNEINRLEKRIKPIFNQKGLDRVLCCYALSHYFYFKNDDHSKAAFQSAKILYVLQMSRGKFRIPNRKRFLRVVQGIVENSLYSVYRSYNSSTRLEIERMRGIFKKEDLRKTNKFHHTLNSLPSISEVQEMMMIYKLFEIEYDEGLLGDKSHEKIHDYLSRYNPSLYANSSGMYSRLNSLYIKIRANHKVFKDIKKHGKHFDRQADFHEIDDNSNLRTFWQNEIEKMKKFFIKGYTVNFDDVAKEEDEKVEVKIDKRKFEALKKEVEDYRKEDELIKYLIADSIYCLTEVIRILKTFGITYITNHSVFGYAYEARNLWCKYLEDYDRLERSVGVLKIEEDTKQLFLMKDHSLYRTVRNLIGSQAMSNLAPKYNLEKTIAHYVRSIEAHEGKFTYLEMTENMYYLDNDYNDNHLHFFAALERYKIKVKDIEGRINDSKKELRTSHLYKMENYLFDPRKINGKVNP